MKHIETPLDLKRELGGSDGRTVGMVPTMGALHRGHRSLVERSVDENDITVVSIFVNPTQFNNPDDLAKYPRTIEADLEILSGILGPGDIVFTPEAEALYSEEKIPDIDLGHLDTIMEGKHRPGHFMGVVRIVKILFDLCEPGRAYFGRKDFQQLAVIKAMVKHEGMKTEIIECPTVREASGLAMSSRNERLAPVLRSRAGIIFHTLRKYSEQSLPFDVKLLKEKVIGEINAARGFEVEYFEIVDDDELKPVNSYKDIAGGKNYTGCIAVYAGDVRLIDNIKFSFQFIKG